MSPRTSTSWRSSDDPDVISGPLVVLVGAPGAGKSTVGRALARGLGVDFRDTDLDIEHAAGAPISDIFVDHGEAHFRALEIAAVETALAEHGGVLALGGGAVLDERTRARLAGHRVVWLDVDARTAAKRVGLARDRPLLAMNPRAHLRELLAAREPLYAAVAKETIHTSELEVDDIVARLRSLLPATVPINTRTAGQTIEVGGSSPYEVRIGAGVLADLPLRVAGARRVGLIHGSQPVEAVAGVRAALHAAGHLVTPIAVPDGESGKSLQVAAQCWDQLAEAGLTRSDVIVGLGGGAVTDLAGFVAATWLRGVGFISVPTTLLGMVDAAVGGKTAINIAAGKNLVGAFYPPSAVIADLGLLTTLPDAEYRSGLAEVVKCGFIADPTILDLLGADPTGREQQADLVTRAVRVKAEVVSEDLTEIGRREILNYGHTLGHALEVTSGYAMRHGEAISVGMVFAAQLARHAGLLDRRSASRHRDLLTAMGLPTTCDAQLNDLLVPMRIDKKARGDALRFVVLEDIARPRILEAPSSELIEAAYADIAV